MRKLLLASSLLLPLGFTAPAFSQGATMSPPSPNAATSMPQPPNSVPPGARTMAPGTTGMQREGDVSTTRYSRSHRRRMRHRAHNPDMPAGQTVPTPQSQ